LQAAPPKSYTMYVHAQQPGKVETDLFRDCLLESEPGGGPELEVCYAHDEQRGALPPRVGGRAGDRGRGGRLGGQVEALFSLLREAVKERSNKWFLILNDGCLPMVGFETCYTRLQAMAESSFEVHPPKVQEEMLKELKKMDTAEMPSFLKEAIDEGDLQAHSVVGTMLVRGDAELLLEADPDGIDAMAAAFDFPPLQQALFSTSGAHYLSASNHSLSYLIGAPPAPPRSAHLSTPHSAALPASRPPPNPLYSRTGMPSSAGQARDDRVGGEDGHVPDEARPVLPPPDQDHHAEPEHHDTALGAGGKEPGVGAALQQEPSSVLKRKRDALEGELDAQTMLKEGDADWPEDPWSTYDTNAGASAAGASGGPAVGFEPMHAEVQGMGPDQLDPEGGSNVAEAQMASFAAGASAPVTFAGAANLHGHTSLAHPPPYSQESQLGPEVGRASVAGVVQNLSRKRYDEMCRAGKSRDLAVLSEETRKLLEPQEQQSKGCATRSVRTGSGQIMSISDGAGQGLEDDAALARLDRVLEELQIFDDAEDDAACTRDWLLQVRQPCASLH